MPQMMFVFGREEDGMSGRADGPQVRARCFGERRCGRWWETLAALASCGTAHHLSAAWVAGAGAAEGDDSPLVELEERPR